MNYSSAWEKQYSKNALFWRGNAQKLPKIPENSKILELGVGTGKSILELSTKDYDITAIDISESAVNLCKSELKNIGGNAKVLVMDGLKLAFEDGSFDVIIASHYFAHFLEKDLKIAVKEACRVLKPKGRLFFKDFSNQDFRFGQGNLIEKGTFERNEGILTHYFTQDEIMAIFGEFFDIMSLKTLSQKKKFGTQDLERVFWIGEFVRA